MNKETLKRGALAGMGGGVVMAMWSMIALWLTGAGFWSPLNLIASTLWHGAPLGAAFSSAALVLGLVVHMMMSMALGIAFAVAIRAIPKLTASAGTRTMTGMAFGLMVWVVMQYGIWPVFDPSAAAKFTPWVFALGHLMFGAATALLIGASPARRQISAPQPHRTPA